MDLELSGKHALVSGGSRGIGKQIARQLAAEGASVAIAARDLARVNETAEEIAAESGAKVIGVSVDTRDDALVKAMVHAVADALGGIDILVNAAATPALGPAPRFDGVTEEDFLQEMNTKVMGYLRCVQAVAPYMIESGWGRIVNISGMAARRTGSVIGSARNVAVVALTKNLADELGEHGINVNLVHPGLTVTERSPAGAASRAHNNSIGRIPDAAEVATVVTFLCSPRSVAITGDVITACGGNPGPIFY